ncbi:MAG: hypothetical protein ACOY3Z_12835 [Thermodesulfobacteriota bacterium]
MNEYALVVSMGMVFVVFLALVEMRPGVAEEMYESELGLSPPSQGD